MYTQLTIKFENGDRALFREAFTCYPILHIEGGTKEQEEEWEAGGKSLHRLIEGGDFGPKLIHESMRTALRLMDKLREDQKMWKDGQMVKSVPSDTVPKQVPLIMNVETLKDGMVEIRKRQIESLSEAMGVLQMAYETVMQYRPALRRQIVKVLKECSLTPECFDTLMKLYEDDCMNEQDKNVLLRRVIQWLNETEVENNTAIAEAAAGLRRFMTCKPSEDIEG